LRVPAEIIRSERAMLERLKAKYELPPAPVSPRTDAVFRGDLFDLA